MNFPRTILMSADCIGGVWTYALELIRALDAYDVRFVLATFGRKLSPAQAREAATLPNVELCQSTFKLEWMEDPWDDIARAGDWLMNLQEHFQPDLVHLNHYAHCNLNWNVPVLVVGHSCVLSWWSAVKGEDAPTSWDRYAQIVSEGLSAADVVAAPSEFMLSELYRFYGPFRRSVVIPNGRSFPRVRRVWKQPFIFASGRLWDAAKNVQALCDIAPQLPWPVYIAGEAADGVCEEHVVRVGQLSSPEMLDYLSRASIYALPARYEPFGLSVLEAALAGCALVLGDVPSLRQIWDGAALFVPPNNHAELQQSIIRLIEDENLRTGLAAAAHQRAGYYTSERLAANYMKVYQSLMSETVEAQCVS